MPIHTRIAPGEMATEETEEFVNEIVKQIRSVGDDSVADMMDKVFRPFMHKLNDSIQGDDDPSEFAGETVLMLSSMILQIVINIAPEDPQAAKRIAQYLCDAMVGNLGNSLAEYYATKAGPH